MKFSMGNNIINIPKHLLVAGSKKVKEEEEKTK